MQKKKYKYIFFDLDRTLWDFEKNMSETLCDLYDKYLSQTINASSRQFIEQFSIINNILWEQYRNGLINKEILRQKRFYLTIQKFGIKDKGLSDRLNNEYLNICPLKTHLVSQAKEITEYLKEKYLLFILTNGFIDTQRRKLAGCGLNHCFQKIISSEEIGYNKPHPKIFAYAVNSLNAKKNECIMIGDDLEVDIKGALNYGIDQVFVNFLKIKHRIQPTYEIVTLGELKQIL